MGTDGIGDESVGKEIWLVRDIVLHRPDSRGQTIEHIFSKVSGKFAIYSADEKIWIHYADDGVRTADDRDLGEEQRKALAPLRALRGQIDGLLRKLRIAHQPGNDDAEIRYFNQRVADALFNALQGSPVSASVDLVAIKGEILDRLRSLGRLQFARSTLLATFLTLVALTVVIFFIARVEAQVTGCPLLDTNTLRFMHDDRLWAAGLFGALGAWFSIALNLRKADPQLSTSKLDNLVDPVLRIVIAVLAASILFTMVRLGLFTITVGNTELNWSQTNSSPGDWHGLHVAIFLAFLAGFSERLVGNLLDSAAQSNDPTAAGAAAALSPDGSETDPRGRGVGGGAPPASGPTSDDDPDPDPPPRREDDLMANATPDASLPASTGGMESETGNRGGRI